MKILKVFMLLLMCIVTSNSASASDFVWGPYRGMSTGVGISEKDVIDFSKTGGNLLRVGFSQQPLMSKDDPYGFNEAAFSKLNQIVSWCRKYHVKVIIDPHTTPGTQRTTTTLPNDVLWQDTKYHDLLNTLWARIAKDYANNNDVIVGYDLLNEPSGKVLSLQTGAANYNQLAQRLIKTIRTYDSDTPIIIEPPVGRDVSGNWVNRLEGVNFLPVIGDSRIIVSPHMYEPRAFTHQGVKNFETGIQYPGVIDGKYWDKDALRRALQPVRDWQIKNHAVVYIGEFSASSASGEGGTRYLRDLIDLFEEYGWSWSYHAWRSAPVWDAEKISADQVQAQLTPNTKTETRLELLKEAFTRNTLATN